ncbi:MAG: hypothetical protein RLY21_761 [Planctomycetota bacterium]
MNSLISSLTLRTIRTRLAVTAIAVGCALAGASTAEAQFGGRSGMASMFTPDFLPRDLPIFVDALSLEEWQRPVLEVLLQDYDANFTTAADGVRSKMSSFKDIAAGANAERVIELISEPLVAWTAEKKKLREDFLASVRGTLGDTQLENWPRLERALLREKSLPLGELSGESVDLTIVVREVQASPLALDAARGAIEQYEIALHEALSTRDAALDDAIAPLLKAMSNADANSGVAMQESLMQKRMLVRDAQDAGLIAIRDALGSEYGAEFERRAMQKAFPQVFRPDPVTPLFEAVQALPDLTDDQKKQVAELKNQFDAELRTVQNDLVAAFKATEPYEPRRRTELARQKAEGATVRLGDAPQVEQAKKQREDLYEKYRALLTAILSPEQLEALPGGKKEPTQVINPDKLKDSPAQLGDGTEQLEDGAPGRGDTNPRDVPDGDKPASTKPGQSADSGAGNGFGINNSPTVKQRPRG